jgi:hypothetical protein
VDSDNSVIYSEGGEGAQDAGGAGDFFSEDENYEYMDAEDEGEFTDTQSLDIPYPQDQSQAHAQDPAFPTPDSLFAEQTLIKTSAVIAIYSNKIPRKKYQGDVANLQAGKNDSTARESDKKKTRPTVGQSLVFKREIQYDQMPVTPQILQLGNGQLLSSRPSSRSKIFLDPIKRNGPKELGEGADGARKEAEERSRMSRTWQHGWLTSPSRRGLKEKQIAEISKVTDLLYNASSVEQV